MEKYSIVSASSCVHRAKLNIVSGKDMFDMSIPAVLVASYENNSVLFSLKQGDA